ncbi:hypothetical protein METBISCDRAFT_13218 [Metschnikowia bicuspidata]|uniref:Zn(2)-C6 fungal-type domain-containing protein n=1 Tax=Metschnikowia bicuspidata TaxID=27322 RepID=A0A4P9ZG20_9ASCO|nr:hypothetical protein METBISCDRAFT_13218 [Metschnikowia bicuspidata]
MEPLEKRLRRLKSCRCCRANKTMCDSMQRRPLPCSYCAKRNIACLFDVAKPANRDNNRTGEAVRLVQGLHRLLNGFVARKEQLVGKLIHSALFSQSLASELEKLFIDPIPTRSHCGSFTIHSDLISQSHTISEERARELFGYFRSEFCNYLPVLPDSFFQLDLHHIHEESDLLFWTIIVTSYITDELTKEYHLLAAHVQNLVVVNCWFKTSRLLFSLVALLILTSWPLPTKGYYNIQDNIAVKYSSLMKSLALQFGLHKLKHIDEFSKKTNVDIDARSDVNNIIRERLYKFVNINSNYWLVYLGISNSNYNGSHQDYIINKATSVDLFHKEKFSDNDNFINSLLKISLVQLRMNERMSDLLATPNKVEKLIHLNMFETILLGYISDDSPLYKHDLISLSLEFSKLQLFVYSLSESDISLPKYKRIIMRTLSCCEAIVELFEKCFDDRTVFELIPIHYSFSIKLAVLVLFQIHSSPLLPSLESYASTKKVFRRAYDLLRIDKKKKSSTTVLQVSIEKVDRCNNMQIWAKKSKTGNFFLIEKMTKYFVSISFYDMLWQVYESERHVGNVTDVKWETFGLDPRDEKAQDIIQYFAKPSSIFD